MTQKSYQFDHTAGSGTAAGNSAIAAGPLADLTVLEMCQAADGCCSGLQLLRSPWRCVFAELTPDSQ